MGEPELEVLHASDEFFRAAMASEDSPRFNQSEDANSSTTSSSSTSSSSPLEDSSDSQVSPASSAIVSLMLFEK